MSKIAIEVKSLVKNFGEGASLTRVLRGIDTTITHGEFVIIFGPSGSGKSTLLNIINGLEIPTGGDIIVNGENLSKLSEEQRAHFHQSQIGMVFQAYNLIPSLTVIQNITLPLVFAKIPLIKRQNLALKLLKDFDLESLANRLPSEISGGQQQRVGIMRALINQPPIIIADEPTGNLDSVATANVMDLFHRLSQNYQNTMVVVTHDQSLFKYADRIIHILDGKVIKESLGHSKRTKQAHSLTVFDKTLRSTKDPATLRLLKLLSALLSSYQLPSFNEQELAATLKYMDSFSKGRLTVDELFENLDKPLSQHGAGLYRSTARHIANSLENMLEILQ